MEVPYPIDPISNPIAAAKQAQQAMQDQAIGQLGLRPITPLANTPAEARMRASEAKLKVIETDPKTTERLGEAAAETMKRWPHCATPVVVAVKIPSRRGGGHATGYAEVGRCLSLGSLDYKIPSGSWGEAKLNGPVGLSTAGTLIQLPAHSGKLPTATVALTDRMRWTEPPQVRPWSTARIIFEPFFRAELLVRLTSALDADRMPSGIATHSESETPLSGRTISARDQKRVTKVQTRLREIHKRREDLTHLFGSPEHPSVNGPPTSYMRKSWREIQAIEAEMDKLRSRLRELEGR